LTQGLSEPIADFIAKVQRSTQAKVSHAGATEALARSVIWEGLNKELRQAVAPVCNGPLEDWIIACRDLGSPAYTDSLMAQAFAMAIRGNGQQGDTACWECGCQRHTKCSCPQGAKTNIKDTKALPKTLCPQCHKGYHWDRDYKSKYDKDGKPLNSKRGKPQPDNKGSTHVISWE
jgi:hypothetical protein